MLLLIALANSAGAFFANAPGVDTTPRGLERYYNVILFTLVHSRAFPLFAIMFGYGLVQLARRQDEAGSSRAKVRALLVRRNAWLVAFGAVHGILLYAGDFLAAYGLVGIAFTWLLLRRGDRFYRLVLAYLALAACYVAVLAVVVGLGLSRSTERAPVPTGQFPSMAADSYGASLLARLAEWPGHTLTLLPIILFVWVGAWAARRRILEEPERHLRFLRTAALVGLGVGIAGGLPMGLFTAGFLEVDAPTAPWVKLLYETSGLFGAIGYAALFGWVVAKLSQRTPTPRSRPVVRALAALGQRSLSGYVFQSVAWLVLVPPFGIALGTHVDSPTFAAAGSALAVWLITVVVADLMRRHSYRGPAELLLRRLTYGPAASARR
jgi:uncharacterized membrane protein YeiB